MEIEEVKKLALEMKANIEKELRSFRDATGYIPRIDIETKTRNTNDRAFISQTVMVTLTIQ